MSKKNTQNDEEIIAEEEVQEGPNLVKRLRNEIKSLKKENKELLEGWQRSRADFANLEKSKGKDYERAKNLAKVEFLDDFLKVMDSFDMAFSNKEAWEAVDDNWRLGVEYIYSQAELALSNNGIESFGKIGDEFDPKLHYSSETINTDDENMDEKIVQVIQKGYKMGETIIRPANVKVANYKT